MRYAGIVTLLGAALTLSGCSGSAGTGSAAQGEAQSAAQGEGETRAAFDPPSAFGESEGLLPSALAAGKTNANGVVVEPLAVALVGTNVLSAEPEAFRLYDGLSGDLLAENRPPGTPHMANTLENANFPLRPPALATVNGQTLAAVPISTAVAGSGTTADRNVVEVLAVDAATGRLAWSTQLPLPPWAGSTWPDLRAVAVDTDGTTMIIRVGEADITGQNSITYGVDLATRDLLWQQDGFGGYAVAGGNVVGLRLGPGVGESGRMVAAVDAQTGAESWTMPTGVTGRVLPGGPTIALVDSRDLMRPVLTKHNAATGEILTTDEGNFDGVDCHYDGLSVTVCEKASGDWTATFDETSGEWLWGLPDPAANRIAPQVTAVYHGVVYGHTPNSVVLLEATTGQDLPTAPRIAPLVVNEYVAVAPSDDGNLAVYPTAG